MKLKMMFFGFLLYAGISIAQKPILYIQLVTHNEPGDNLDANKINYTNGANNIQQMADLVVNKQVKWNFQSSDGFVLGALKYETNPLLSNIFKTLASSNYSSYIEIDPRNKNKDGNNLADQWYLLDSLGANPSYNVGGFLYSTNNPQDFPIDWIDYIDTIQGANYGNKWMAKLLSGAGSYPPHDNDLNDFGIFKPNTANDFYTHKSSNKVWCIGNGCAPLLEDANDVQYIIDLIQGQVDSIQNGLWPADKFYVTRIMTNQRDFSSTYFTNLSTILDSLKLIDDTKIKWATLSESFAAFEQWQKDSKNEYSQWLCGETYTGVNSVVKEESLLAYPNPVSDLLQLNFSNADIKNIQLFNAFGQLVMQEQATSNLSLNVSDLPAGVYWIKAGNQQQTFVKQ